MADNVTTQTATLATIPTSTVIATDEVNTGGGAAHVQLMKLLGGADGSTERIEGTAANGLEVDVTRVTGTVHVDDNSGTLSVDDGAGSLTVDGTVAVSNLPTTVDTNSGNKSASTLRVVLATDQPALTNKLLVTPDLPSGAATAAKQPALGTAGSASTDVITVQGIASGTAQPVSLASVPSHAVTNAGTFAVQVSGTPSVDTEIPAAATLADATSNPSTPTIGTDISMYNGSTWDRVRGDTTGGLYVQPKPVTSGGYTIFSNTALSNTKTAVKAGAGQVYGYVIHNPAAATTYIQVWNVAIGSITVGTTAPTWVIGIPAGATANVEFGTGIAHSTEINIAATTTPTGSTAPATAAVVAMFYK